VAARATQRGEAAAPDAGRRAEVARPQLDREARASRRELRVLDYTAPRARARAELGARAT
jgi:hypothetical protein